MAIWLGQDGGLRIKRSAEGPVFVHVDVADVDAGAKRLSADRVVGALITGDLVSVTYVDEAGGLLTDPLPFISPTAWADGNAYPDGQWYVHVDPLGGVRFYSSWAVAISGFGEDAVELQEPSARCRVRLDIHESNDRCLAQTKSWELNTDREIADITSLGEGFKQNMATLVSGSGTISCMFNGFRDQSCEETYTQENSVYLHQLALRQEVGARFTGVFLLKRYGTQPIGLDPIYYDRQLFYLCDCVISAVACSVNTEDIIHSNIEFVTTGQIKLLYDIPSSYLLQEDADPSKILQEDESGVLLELPI